MSYAVVPTTALFDAVVAKLAGNDSAVDLFRSRLVLEHGLLE
jgi:hypothetical protein